MKEVYIVSVARTPLGAFGGKLSTMTAIDLGALAIKEAVNRAGIKPEAVQEAFIGNVISANLGQAPAKQAALKAGLAKETPTTTVNKVCASGMKAIMLATQSILLGDNDIIVAGGMECMSKAPFMLDRARFGYGYGDNKIYDAISRDALQDPYKGYMMGNAGEVCAKKYNFSREEQDDYAIESYNRATKAYESGKFKNEIVPVPVPQRKGDPVMVEKDEELDRVRFDKIKSLRPAFDKEGTITAANASKINDGAAAVVLMSKEKAEELGVKPLARILSYADASQDPEWFTTTPSKAMPKAIAKAGLSIDKIDFFEINEAFSVVALANIKELGIEHAKTNVYGGAVSLGHPVGVSGARILIALLSVLQNEGGTIGCAGICNGGGGASAMVIEKL
ncbi:MAG: acetyl-CoA C-acyltransferase [Chitinophagales bacterium]